MARKITITFFTDRELNDSPIQALLDEAHEQGNSKRYHIRHQANNMIEIFPWPNKEKLCPVCGAEYTDAEIAEYRAFGDSLKLTDEEKRNVEAEFPPFCVKCGEAGWTDMP